MPLLSGVRESNEGHKRWAYDALTRALGDLRGKRIGVLGLTYKPGTNTLRRSAAVWLCQEIRQAGGHAVAYDPAINGLPAYLEGSVTLAASAVEALRGSSAVVIATEWPEFRSLAADELADHLSGERAVIDAGAFLGKAPLEDRRIRYYTVGTIN
jgi:UDPglucose 6-dehydrogenase